MRARAAVSSILASFGLLAIGWQLGAPLAMSVNTVSLVPVTSGATGATDSPAQLTSVPPVAPSVSAGPPDGIYVGGSVHTQFGDVQVQVTLAGGSISDVGAVHLTDSDGRSVQISNRAAPILRSEVLSSQSAQVTTVSGATYTSMAYLQSLQSALDQAGA